MTALLLYSLSASAATGATHHENAFQEGDLLDLRVYLSTTPRFKEFNDTSACIWETLGIPYSSSAAERTATVNVSLTPHLLKNGSLFAHIFFTKAGASPDPAAAAYDRWATTSLIKSLVAFDARLKPVGLVKLLTGEPAPWEEALRRGLADARVRRPPLRARVSVVL